MKILLANNFFYLRGGSERVFFDEANLLKSNGHEVSFFATESEQNLPSKFSDYFVSELNYGVRTIPRFIYCSESRRKIRKLIETEKPDVAHFHNIYQDISPSVLPAVKEMQIPSVLTLHDYKLVCPNYTMVRDGRICEECRGGRFYRCATNRCKQGSLLYSIVLSLEAYAHRMLNVWAKHVDCFISPSQFLKAKMVDFGWPSSAIEVIHNSLPLDRYLPSFRPGDYFLYLGRLSGEKGLPTLLDAFLKLPGNARLVLVGSGPLEAELRQRAEGDERVTFTGHIGGEQLVNITREARAVVLPSEWYENAPMSIIESMAYGKPVIGARIGGIPEMIDHEVNGFLFEPGDAEDLREKLELVATLPDGNLSELGKAAREKAEREYGAELHYERLMEVYHKVLGELTIT